MTEVLFATEYDSAHIIVHMLMRSPTNHLIFPLIVKHKPSNLLRFCLQTQKCHGAVRTAPVFVCAAVRAIDLTGPVPASLLSDAIDEQETRVLYEELFEDCADAADNDGGGSGDEDAAARGDGGADLQLRQLVYLNKEAVIRHLNRTFLTPTSPSWFTSTFGVAEGVLLLTMSYYLFERQRSTIQTTKDYVRCFLAADTGTAILAYASMTEFSRTLLRSGFRGAARRFAAYARRKNARDLRELELVDRQIGAFRDGVRLPDAAYVHFVYLAYRTALSRGKVAEYCGLTAYDPAVPPEGQCSEGDSFFATSLRRDLLDIMERYFSPEHFFRDYVSREAARLPPEVPLSGYDLTADGDRTVGFFGQIHATSKMLDRVNAATDGVFSPVAPSLAGLLHLCASQAVASLARDGGGDRRVSRRNCLFANLAPADAPVGPTPVFRVELSDNRHVFCTVLRERWSATMFQEDPLRFLPASAARPTDETLTAAVWLREEHVATQDYQRQLYLTRHEVFNERLPVFNFVGDVDIKLRDGAPAVSEELFFSICRGLRRAVLSLWGHVFGRHRVDPKTHHVYVFKTACPAERACRDPDDSEDGEDWDPSPALLTASPGEPPAFCRCKVKLGLRLVCPFPAGTAVVGSEPLRTLAGLLDHFVCMDHALSDLINVISHPGQLLDAGIYRNGRSVRVPYMYKVDRETGRLLCGRLNPVFVVPDGCDAREFARAQMRLENLLHHAPPPSAPRGEDGGDGERRHLELLVRLRNEASPTLRAPGFGPADGPVFRTPKRHLLPLMREHLNGSGGRSHSGEEGRGRDAASPSAGGDGGDRGDGGAADDKDDDDDDDDDDDEEDGCVSADAADDTRAFLRKVGWPRLLEQINAHYAEDVSSQFSDVLFAVRSATCVQVKQLRCGRGKDFRCLARTHGNPQETVQVFVDIRAGKRGVIWLTLWSRCFARKCNSNSKRTHVSLKVKPPARY